MKKIGLIGAGASGIFAAINIKTEDNEVTILEKNSAIGQKILMTGNGRCNITNSCYYEEFLNNNIVRNKKFLYSSFTNFDNYATMDFFENKGLSLFSQEDGRVFPKSEKASDVVKFFEKEIIDKNIKLVTAAKVMDVSYDENFLVKTESQSYEFDSLIIATGGLSYPMTGSSGDGYNFAKKLGHKLTKTYPSLVPIFFDNPDLNQIKALNLEAIDIFAKTDRGDYSLTGDLLVTKNFITGPLALKLSSFLIGKKVDRLYIDLAKEGKSELDNKLIKIFDQNPNKDISNILKEILPNALIEIILNRAGIDPSKKSNQINKDERKALVENIKEFDLKFDRLGGYNTAIVTRGGVDVSEIDPKTMESKLIPNLYFIGEVLDVDGLTGGYNLQIAFTTAAACARSIKEQI